MRLILSVILITLFTACQKDEDLSFTTVRKLHPHEGVYEGTFQLDCDSLGIHVKSTSNVIRVTSIDGETYSIDNMQAIGTVTGKIMLNGDVYTYINCEAVDITDCGLLVSYVLSGSGVFSDSTLVENGSGVAYRNNKPYRVTWNTRSILK